MKIDFVQSGGLLGAIKGCKLDTSALATDVAQELAHLVKHSGISNSGEFLSDSSRDLHQYEITIEGDSGKVAVVVDDQSIPTTAKPLLGFLKKHARPLGLK